MTRRDAFPFEHPIVDVPSDSERVVEAVVFDAADEPLVRRLVETRQPPEQARLLRLRLNDECMAGVMGRVVSCPGETCVAGVCQSPSIASADLEPYTAEWIQAPQSPCPVPGDDQGDDEDLLDHEWFSESDWSG